MTSVTSCVLLLQDQGSGWPGAFRTRGLATLRPGVPLRGEELRERWEGALCLQRGRL